MHANKTNCLYVACDVHGSTQTTWLLFWKQLKLKNLTDRVVLRFQYTSKQNILYVLTYSKEALGKVGQHSGVCNSHGIQLEENNLDIKSIRTFYSTERKN